MITQTNLMIFDQSTDITEGKWEGGLRHLVKEELYLQSNICENLHDDFFAFQKGKSHSIVHLAQAISFFFGQSPHKCRARFYK